MINQELAGILNEIHAYLDMEGIPFKPRAYEKVSEIISGLSDGVDLIYKRRGLKGIEEIPGVGRSIAEKIEEFIKTGKIKYHEELKKKIPVDLRELSSIEGLGPKKIKALYDKLRVKDLKDLQLAVEKGRIRNLQGFGEKSEEKIGKGIEFLKKSSGRFIFGEVAPLLENIRATLAGARGVKTAEIAGSFRRRKDTIGDGDILVMSKNPKLVMDMFINMSEVADVIAHGETKSAIKLKNGLNVDLRVLEPDSYGAALAYFTGSKDHNVAIRQIAIDKGMKLSEYGLFKGEKKVSGRTEEEIYKKLGMVYIPPEIRENTGEIEAAKKGKLPRLIELRDILGDMQIQTDWSDGSNSILEMAEAAIKLGRRYILITDHTKSLTIANGLDAKRLFKQIEEIDKLNKEIEKKKTDFKILKGTECDILKDGKLDMPDEILEKLDIVGASIHSHFNLPLDEQTKRMKRAMSNKNVDIIFHPTGRLLNKRDSYLIDMDEIINFAKETGTVLEINAFPERSDLKDEYIRKCVSSEVKMVINSDAHSIHHLQFIEYGVYQARRGWAEKKDIVNAWPFGKMLKMLK